MQSYNSRMHNPCSLAVVASRCDEARFYGKKFIDGEEMDTALASIIVVGLSVNLLVCGYLFSAAQQQCFDKPMLYWSFACGLFCFGGALSVSAEILSLPHIATLFGGAILVLSAYFLFAGIQVFFGLANTSYVAKIASILAWCVIPILLLADYINWSTQGSASSLMAILFLLSAITLQQQSTKMPHSIMSLKLLILFHSIVMIVQAGLFFQAAPSQLSTSMLQIAFFTHVLLTVATAILLPMIRLMKENKRWAHMANTDSLTGLLNRRAFLSQVKDALKNDSNLQTKCSLLMVDIDFFKQINDSFGHAVGDQVLIEVSNRLQAGTRENDKVGRLGGEEFGIFMADTNYSKSKVVAQRLVESIASTPFVVASNEVELTISIGAVANEDASIAIDALLLKADKALYQAKRSGRNKLCWSHI